MKAHSTLGRLGEWGWLDRLLPRLSKGLPGRVVLGPGDDAALIRAGKETWAITTDMLVEGVHFRQEWTSAEALGHKTLAVNLSDLAAMGDVEPTVGVLSAGLPPGAPVSFLEGFHRGFSRLARRHGFFLVGGDTVRSDKMVFSLTALGRVSGPVFRRKGARPGDVLMVTGTLGDAAAGLSALQRVSRNKNFPPPLRGRAGRGVRQAIPLSTGSYIPPALLRRLHRPEPRLAWAKDLARTGAVTAGLDSSDGFWRSAKILARSSGVGLRVRAESLPVSPALARWAGPRAVDFALVGGEDYELVFTARPDAVRRVEALGWARAVGEILPAARGLTVFENGVAREVPSGFEHFDR